MRIVTVLARHGSERYSDAISNVDAFFEVQLPRVERELVVIDNSLPEDHVEPLGPARTLIGSSNASWEFSAWDRGIEYVGQRIQQFDLVHLVTSAFKALDCSYLDVFDSLLLTALQDGAPAALGHIDYYPEPVVVLGRSLQAWIRSSWIFLPPQEVQLLGSLISVSARQPFFSGDPLSPFREDAPMSANYQQYILDWQTGGGLWTGNNEWHSRFDLSHDSLAYFETKTLAIINEQMLSHRLRRQGCGIVDVEWLSLSAASLVPVDGVRTIPSWRTQVTIREAAAVPIAANL